MLGAGLHNDDDPVIVTAASGQPSYAAQASFRLEAASLPRSEITS